MAGTKFGAAKAKLTIYERHGADFYQRIGAKGGNNGKTGGFATDVECDCPIIEGSHFKRQCAGVTGGMKSRRGQNKK